MVDDRSQGSPPRSSGAFHSDSTRGVLSFYSAFPEPIAAIEAGTGSPSRSRSTLEATLIARREHGKFPPFQPVGMKDQCQGSQVRIARCEVR